ASTSNRCRRRHTRATTPTTTSAAQGRYSSWELLRLPNRRADRMSNSLGASRRCMNVDSAPNPIPNTTPISSITCRSPRLPANSQVYRAVANPTISRLCSTTFGSPSVRDRVSAPKKNTSPVCITTYRASNPMMEGVRIRLLVAVWNSTVATAWQAATITMVATETTRMFTISQNPRVPGAGPMSQVSTSTAAATASTVRMTNRGHSRGRRAAAIGRTGAGGAFVTVSCITPLPQQQEDEHHRADQPEHHRDRHLERHPDAPADDVAGHGQPHSAHTHPGQVGAQVVPPRQGHHVRHDQPEERQHAHHHGGDPGGQRHQAGAEEHHQVVAHPDAGSDLLPQPGDGEPV